MRVDSRSYNRGKDGGGSDSQNYTARELLMPDEIPQALRPKGKSRKVGGSAIIFVDEYKPFFIPKFDTLSHPLIDNVGLSFRTNDIMNKTNIEESYKVIKLNRSNNHKQALIDFFAISQEKKEQDIAEIEAEQQAAELDEQAALAHEFDDSDFSDEIVDDLDLENEIENEISQDVNPLLAKINKGGEN